MKTWLATGLLGVSAIASAATITNADIIKLLEAQMPESVILQSIATSTTKFDSSPTALIALKNKGASPAVLNAVISPKSLTAAPAPAGAAAPAARATPVAASNAINPEEAIVVQNGQETPMQYLTAQMRTAARALGFGGVATYASLTGTKAARRLPGEGFEFIVSVPKNAQVAGYVTIASFAIRNNGTREVSTGGGYMSYSSGIAKDRVVPITSEQLADQSRAKEGFVLYKVKPEKPLASGEYALVFYTAEVRVAGFFAQAANSFYDFGVD